ncbi:MAG TPA: DUF2283 domain-containing protein [Rhodothermales bacterium]|nr:DUF2283 domain-containing protein [Rhodothermales bacterium]
MRITYSAKRNVAYIHFQDRPKAVNTVEASEDVLIDVGPDGSVYGIELLNAREQLRSGGLALLEVENEESGERTRVALPFSEGTESP